MNVNLSVKVIAGLVLLTAVISSCAGLNTQESPPDTSNNVETQPTEVPATAEAKDPVRIEANGEVPFYARFGENETFSNGEWTAIIFYRSPDCIPADFNLNQFFHFPGDSGPGAFACTPPTTTSVEYWVNGPQTDPAPLKAEMTGRGAVPVWFIAQAEIEAALAVREWTTSWDNPAVDIVATSLLASIEGRIEIGPLVASLRKTLGTVVEVLSRARAAAKGVEWQARFLALFPPAVLVLIAITTPEVGKLYSGNPLFLSPVIIGSGVSYWLSMRMIRNGLSIEASMGLQAGQQGEIRLDRLGRVL